MEEDHTPATTAAEIESDAPCCPSIIPPVVIGAEEYELRGTYEVIDGLRTYVTGPPDSKKGILVVYDIFGFFPQTLKGADILASSRGYRVFMPDFFEGTPADIAWYPPVTEGQGKKLMEWFATRTPEKVGVRRIPSWMNAVEGIKEWGILGYCWGGKVVSLLCNDTIQPSSMRGKFKVAVQCHPGLIDPAEALEISTPMCVLASKEEPVEEVRLYGENLKGEKHVEVFGEMVHGWMSARADLGDPEVVREFERGYGVATEWVGRFL